MTLTQHLIDIARAGMTRKSAPIRTEYVYPPIPTRAFDWSAVRDDYDGAPDAHCPIGWGPTEAAAIADLLETEAERER